MNWTLILKIYEMRTDPDTEKKVSAKTEDTG